jgi:outer membrane protein OmpA-like peptidoglycan-associated protein
LYLPTRNRQGYFFGLILTGCPQKTVVKEEVARFEAERATKEAREKELARIREEEARKAREEFEKSLTAKKELGIEGEVFERRLLKDIHFDFDKYDIRPGDAEILRGNAALLSKYPTIKLHIEGHCDERGPTNIILLTLPLPSSCSGKVDESSFYIRPFGLNANSISDIKNPTGLIV